jgi:phosphoglycerate dehydrogenase-like enzyme
MPSDPQPGARLKAVYMQQYAADGNLRLIEDYPEISFAIAATPAQMDAAIDGADILIANNRVYDEDMARIVCAKGTSLRWIQFCTAGVERGVRFGMPRGVPVCAASGIKGPTVAEHAMTLLLASFRRVRDMEDARRRREWARNELNSRIRSVEGATVVIVGFGAIGREIARKAKAFDMRTVIVSRSAETGPNVDEVFPRSALVQVLPRADALILCVPTDADTMHLIGRRELAAMRPDAILVNVGRGELIDEPALIAALKEGGIGGAALDVAETEPLPRDNELWDLPNVLISPHVAGSGKDGYGRFKEIFDENLRRFREGLPLVHTVRGHPPGDDLIAGV